MGLFGSLIGAAAVGAISKAIERAKNKSNSSSYSSGSSSGGVSSSTTNSLRDYMKQMGQPIDYDASTGMTTIGGKQYASGSIPGTTYNPTTGQHYVTDPSALNSILGIDKQPVAEQTYMQPYQQYISDPTSEYINQLKEAQRRSRIAALDKTKEAALRALDTEKANVSPTYYDARNRAAAASDVGAMNFAQYMAARGIKGAAGAMPEIYRQAGLQGQIGALDRQEAANLAAIERQRSNVESGYASDVAAANADVESQAMQAMIDQWNKNRQYELQRGTLTGSLGDERTLAGQQFDYSRSPSNPAVQAQILANRQRELEIVAQEIQNSYLPDTLKLQAERLAQQVKTGSLDYDTALAQLNQIRAQTNAINTPKVSEPTQTEVKNYVIASALTAMNNLNSTQEKNDWLYQHKAEIIQNAGPDAYEYLFNQLYPGAELYNKVKEKEALGNVY